MLPINQLQFNDFVGHWELGVRFRPCTFDGRFRRNEALQRLLYEIGRAFKSCDALIGLVHERPDISRDGMPCEQSSIEPPESPFANWLISWLRRV